MWSSVCIRVVAILPCSRTAQQHRKFATSIFKTVLYFPARFPNRYKPELVDTFGPDLACGTWLAKCGATAMQFKDADDRTLTFTSRASFIRARDELKRRNAKLVYIDASDSAVMSPSFSYLADCAHVRTLRLRFCTYLDGEAITHACHHLRQSLRRLEVAVVTHDVEPTHLNALLRLRAPERIHLYGLNELEEVESDERYGASFKARFIRRLTEHFPECIITWPPFVSLLSDGYDYVPEELRPESSRFY